MSTLGQLSGRISKNLKRVDELTDSLIAIRADVLGKAAALKITPETIVGAKKTVADFLEPLAPVLRGSAEGNDEQKLIFQRLDNGGRQPSDYGTDFIGMVTALRGNAALTREQIDKISEVVGYLQGEVAEEVRRLRSR
jgi:hypothetical protein